MRHTDDCHHPFDRLSGLGTPGWTWCAECGQMVMCSHPVPNWCRYEEDHTKIFCSSCGMDLREKDLVTKMVYAGMHQHGNFRVH